MTIIANNRPLHVGPGGGAIRSGSETSCSDEIRFLAPASLVIEVTPLNVQDRCVVRLPVTSCSTFAALVIEGNLDLDGTLQLEADLDGFSGTGCSVDLVTWGSRSGSGSFEFATLNAPSNSS